MNWIGWFMVREGVGARISPWAWVYLCLFDGASCGLRWWVVRSGETLERPGQRQFPATTMWTWLLLCPHHHFGVAHHRSACIGGECISRLQDKLIDLADHNWLWVMEDTCCQWCHPNLPQISDWVPGVLATSRLNNLNSSLVLVPEDCISMKNTDLPFCKLIWASWGLN